MEIETVKYTYNIYGSVVYANWTTMEESTKI